MTTKTMNENHSQKKQKVNSEVCLSSLPVQNFTSSDSLRGFNKTVLIQLKLIFYALCVIIGISIGSAFK